MTSNVPEIQPSWINTYIGLGFNGDIMFEGPCVLQYMLSLYWVLATLVTNGLVLGMYPTTWLEVTSPCDWKERCCI